MTPVEPTNVDSCERVLTFAGDQSEYNPLSVTIDVEGLVTSEWEPTAEELYLLLHGGRVRLRVHTFDPLLGMPGHYLQPVSLDVIGGLTEKPHD